MRNLGLSNLGSFRTVQTFARQGLSADHRALFNGWLDGVGRGSPGPLALVGPGASPFGFLIGWLVSEAGGHVEIYDWVDLADLDGALIDSPIILALHVAELPRLIVVVGEMEDFQKLHSPTWNLICTGTSVLVVGESVPPVWPLPMCLRFALTPAQVENLNRELQIPADNPGPDSSA